MALTVDQLQAQRDALVTALGNEVAMVKFPDGRVKQYKSTDELQKAITQIDAEILKLSGGTGSRMSFAQHRRGTAPNPGWPRTGDW